MARSIIDPDELRAFALEQHIHECGRALRGLIEAMALKAETDPAWPSRQELEAMLASAEDGAEG